MEYLVEKTVKEIATFVTPFIKEGYEVGVHCDKERCATDIIITIVSQQERYEFIFSNFMKYKLALTTSKTRLLQRKIRVYKTERTGKIQELVMPFPIGYLINTSGYKQQEEKVVAIDSSLQLIFLEGCLSKAVLDGDTSTYTQIKEIRGRKSTVSSKCYSAYIKALKSMYSESTILQTNTELLNTLRDFLQQETPYFKGVTYNASIQV